MPAVAIPRRIAAPAGKERPASDQLAGEGKEVAASRRLGKVRNLMVSLINIFPLSSLSPASPSCKLEEGSRPCPSVWSFDTNHDRMYEDPNPRRCSMLI
jgi:hypothetical protein